MRGNILWCLQSTAQASPEALCLLLKGNHPGDVQQLRQRLQEPAHLEPLLRRVSAQPGSERRALCLNSDPKGSAAAFPAEKLRHCCPLSGKLRSDLRDVIRDSTESL